MHADLLIPCLIGAFILYVLSRNIIINRIKEEPPSTVMNLRYTPGYIFVDVREKDEFFQGHIAKSVNVPLTAFKRIFREIPNDKTLVVICRNGNRAKKAISILRDQGYNNLICLKGGLVAWQKKGYPLEYGN